MTTKLLVFGIILVVLAILVLLPGEKREERPAGTPTVTSETKPGPMGLPPGHPPAGLVLPTIARATVAVQDESALDLGQLELTPNQLVPIPGRPESVRFVEFYTHWNWNQGPVNLSYEEKNPAVNPLSCWF